MSLETNRDLEVREANRRFYDAVADVYEEVDGRRTDTVLAWLAGTLEALSRKTEAKVLLDFGCGSGVVMGCGKRFFDRTYGVDISPEILKVAQESGSGVFCGEGTAIPLKDNSVDVIVCFAVLHHIFDHRPLAREFYRVLKRDGILYTDHDMDSAFNDRFAPLLKIYRFVFDARRRYAKARGEITKELYDLTEVHSEGIDSDATVAALKDAVFRDITRRYHWFGLSGLFNRIMKKKLFKKGLAPLVSITVVK